MNSIEIDSTPLPNYQAYTMLGEHMSPTIEEGDYVVVDLSQRFIRSGDIYVLEYQRDTIICRVLLDRDQIKLIFDGTEAEVEDHVDQIKIIGRVVEIKSMDA
jgi:phage repressor protein C with HTH and peptisase S24 domain